MNHDKINTYNYNHRKQVKQSLERLTKNNDLNIKYTSKLKKLTSPIILFNLDTDDLLIIKKNLLKCLSEFNIEAFEITTELKKLDRILKLRKKPLLDTSDDTPKAHATPPHDIPDTPTDNPPEDFKIHK